MDIFICINAIENEMYKNVNEKKGIIRNIL